MVGAGDRSIVDEEQNRGELEDGRLGAVVLKGLDEEMCFDGACV